MKSKILRWTGNTARYEKIRKPPVKYPLGRLRKRDNIKMDLADMRVGWN